VERARWGLGDAVGGFLLGLLAVVVAGNAYVLATGDTSRTFNLVLVAQGALWLGLLGAPVWASLRKGTRSLDADFGLRVRWSDARIGIPLGLLTQPAILLLYLPFSSLLRGKDLSKPAKDLAKTAHGPAFVALAVLLVVAAPFIEELFFRGLVLRALSRRFGTRWAVAGSSVFFALAHFEGLQFPALLLVGVLLGVLAVRYGRLGPGIWAHGAFNAYAAVLLATHR